MSALKQVQHILLQHPTIVFGQTFNILNVVIGYAFSQINLEKTYEQTVGLLFQALGHSPGLRLAKYHDNQANELM